MNQQSSAKGWVVTIPAPCSSLVLWRSGLTTEPTCPCSLQPPQTITAPRTWVLTTGVNSHSLAAPCISRYGIPTIEPPYLTARLRLSTLHLSKKTGKGKTGAIYHYKSNN